MGMFDCCLGTSATAPASSGAAAAAASSAMPAGVALPGCELLRLLGEGSFGTVILVRERQTGNLYAVKIMSKAQLASEDQLANIALERQVLREAGPHPFIVECAAGFQTENAVVLVLEYLPGGDFYDLLRSKGLLSEEQAQFYLAEVVVGIGELHAHKFVLRDLKLENILLDADGHVRLTDFGLAGKVNTVGDTSITDLSGTAIYQAPEILSGKGHGTPVDWWALGILAFIMMTGKPPFGGSDRAELYAAIEKAEIDLESNPKAQGWDPITKDFIQGLLTKNPAKRLGSGGVQDVISHPFFRGIDWEALLRMELEPPIKLGIEKAGLGEKDAMAAQQAKEQLRKKLDQAAKDRKGVYGVLAEFQEIRAGGRASIGLDFDNKRSDQDDGAALKKAGFSLLKK
ncbi:Serine/threonine-protein kinase gad8 [Porphyridium purpureum]|uniref:Serine/threonine-protein kinase gad8 n=1 Tax=Porphyridium purpureum TaxID=35688 RepID=A0A5J4Z8S3_PORPP|nr:Serine/threonine-protein kinase gad8 [Porphyridium purpureum]|eukprot:POR1268..scf295_1